MRPNSSATRDALRALYLYYNGTSQKDIAARMNLDTSTVSRMVKFARSFVELHYNVPDDEHMEAQLLQKFPHLVDSVVVPIGDPQHALQVVSHAAARYFRDHVQSGSRVAVSCGETLLEMIKALPSQPRLELGINQLSMEGDPHEIHQAPAALVAQLKAKCARSSTVYGIQLPPNDVAEVAEEFRAQIRTSAKLEELREEALKSDHVFMGVGTLSKSPGVLAPSYLNIAYGALSEEQLTQYVQRLGLVGEINNLAFDRQGQECSRQMPELENRFVSILDLADIRGMASKPREHRVVAVASGARKAEAIRVAAESGLFNVLIVDTDTASRVLEH
jgi:DNA-binding transcriptional regulator LsrR (DeoR family)